MLFGRVASLTRHGKYQDVEVTFQQLEFLNINHGDRYGNTLLHIASQNGHKRLCKLFLRKGADLNVQNNSGLTCLHFAFGFGYNDLGEYLKSKGADDSIVNCDHLTCYEYKEI